MNSIKDALVTRKDTCHKNVTVAVLEQSTKPPLSYTKKTNKQTKN